MAYRIWLARYYTPLAHALLDRGLTMAARSEAEKAVNLLKARLSKHPTLPAIQGLLEKSYRVLSRIHRKGGEIGLAEKMQALAESHGKRLCFPTAGKKESL